MSLSLEEIIDEALKPYADDFTSDQIVEALRNVADDYEEDGGPKL